MQKHIGTHWKYRAIAIVLLCFILFLLIVRPDFSVYIPKNNNVYVHNCENSAYPEVVSRILPDYDVETVAIRPFYRLHDGAVVEALDPNAVSALRTGIAKNWRPQYLATVIIAVDRNRTDAQITGWNDLAALQENVGFCAVGIDIHYTMLAIAYGLEGEGFTLKRTAALLAGLNAEGRFVNASFDEPVFICYDYQAAELIKNGRNLEVVVPVEGTLTYEKGLLSNLELKFAGNVDKELLDAGLRLTDGRCDPSLYPDAAAYTAASEVRDYDHLNTVALEVTRTLRREVLHIRLYSSADNREHQYWVLVYIMIVVCWTATIIYRASQKRIRLAALSAGIILLGWITVRLVNWQLPADWFIGHYPWYSYYTFQLSLPLVLLWIAWGVDKRDDAALFPRWMPVPVAIHGTLAAFALTNDLHGLVIRIDFSNTRWSTFGEYGYGFMFYALHAVCFITLATGVVMLLSKGRQALNKKRLAVTFGLLALLAVYGVGYAAKIPLAYQSDVTMVIGVFSLLIFETMLRNGMIPVNTKYAALFAHSPLGMLITGDTGEEIRSSVAVNDDENALMLTATVTGGHVIWSEDISGLNRLYQDISETVDNLRAANAILAAEEKAKRNIQEDIEKAKLLGQLESEISSHIGKLCGIINQMENPEAASSLNGQVLLLLCYIKRRCNLFFMEREAAAITAYELKAFFDELAKEAEFAGGQVVITSDLTRSVPPRNATLLFDFFYSVISRAAEHEFSGMLARLSAENGEVILQLFPSVDVCSFDVNESLRAATASVGGKHKVIDLDYAVGIQLSFPERGEDCG